VNNEPIRKHHDSSTWWATESEKHFVDELGTKKPKNGRPFDPKARHLKALLDYRTANFCVFQCTAGTSSRKDWGDIDPGEILHYVNRKIEEAHGGSKT
jgi:hypothetical protein